MTPKKSAAGSALSQVASKSEPGSAVTQRAKKSKSAAKTKTSTTTKTKAAAGRAAKTAMRDVISYEAVAPRASRETLILGTGRDTWQFLATPGAFGPLTVMKRTSMKQGAGVIIPAMQDAVDRLWALLRSSDESTSNTSMRIPTVLREAAGIAVRELGAAESTTALTSEALRTMLEAVAMGAALDAHYAEFPHARPTLAQVALAAARVDRHPLADYPDILERAAEQIVERRPDADADDVLLWAEAQMHDPGIMM